MDLAKKNLLRLMRRSAEYKSLKDVVVPLDRPLKPKKPKEYAVADRNKQERIRGGHYSTEQWISCHQERKFNGNIVRKFGCDGSTK